MAQQQRRSFKSLPAYLQTNRNNLELVVTDDILYEPEQAQFMSGFVGDVSKLSPQDLERTPKLIVTAPVQQKYQFSIGVAQFDPATQNRIHGGLEFNQPNRRFVSGCFYDDLLNHISLNGGLINDPNRLFGSYYYAWSPPINYDKIVNPAKYFWTGEGNATANGEYITKEPAGSQTTLYQFNGASLEPLSVPIVHGVFPVSPTIGQIVEDASTNDRLLQQYNGASWVQLSFRVTADINNTAGFNAGDYVYVCRTGPNFSRPLLWVYRSSVGRWIAIPVVVSLEPPEVPVHNMVWEDVTLPPQRIFRRYKGDTKQWEILHDYVRGDSNGPTGVPEETETSSYPDGGSESETYLYDTRDISTVDSWSQQNWWRALDDLSISDRSAYSQATRPIIEFWGNLEPAIEDMPKPVYLFDNAGNILYDGDGNPLLVSRPPAPHTGSSPLFNLYAISTDTFDIQPLTVANFDHLDTAPLTPDHFINGQVCSSIFQYVRGAGLPDPVLGFPISYGIDGTPLFDLESESLVITQQGVPVKGYRFYKDTATGYMHCIWERTGQPLVQLPDENGLYEVPKNLRFNPDHVVTTQVSRATYINHFTSVMSSQEDFAGAAYGSNNYRYTEQDLTVGATMIDPEESLLRMMTVLQTDLLDIPDAIRQMARDYNKVMARFMSQLNAFWDDGTIATIANVLSVSPVQAVDLICSAIFVGRNSEFPYHYSRMGTYTQCRKKSDGTVYSYDPEPAPIYIPVSVAQIGAAPPYVPGKFTDFDGVTKIRGHDGSLIPAYGDDRDLVILELEQRFYNTVPLYLTTEEPTFSGHLKAAFRLAHYYGNYTPNPTSGTVEHVVPDYNIGTPVAQDRLFSRAQQVYATWDGVRWLTTLASAGDVFLNNEDQLYYIFNGYYANPIPMWNNTMMAFDYTVNEYRQVVQREFERWVVLHDLDFITNNEYNPDDPFTWNYSSAGIEGNYRGIYRRIYHTVRPHSHPWEVVLYTVMPDWWFDQYPPTRIANDGTPRYANTHQMWANFQAGLLNPITNLIVPSHMLIAPIPVDGNGELLDPTSTTPKVVDETLLVPSAIADDWAYGDGSPIEESFYNSYYYGFAVALAGYLMKPGLFVDCTWSEFYRQIGNTGDYLLWNGPHIVADATLTRPAQSSVPSHLSLDANNEIVVNPGLNAWIAEYTAIIGKSPNLDFHGAILNSMAVLGWKTYTFINANRTSVELLNGDEVPTEDLSVVLHQGPSINEYYQSGIIIVRDIDGFRVFGTDMLNPYFRTELGAKPVSGGQVELVESFAYDGSNRTFVLTQFSIPPSTNDTATFGVLINGFKVSSKFVQILDNTTFALDPVLLMTQDDKVVASVVTASSNPSTQLGTFTVNGFQITYFRYGTGVYVNYPYGYLFQTLNDVVNMMVGHGRWLSTEGWIFERLTNGKLRDWLGAAKTFALWATDLSIQSRGNPDVMKGKIFEFSVMGRQAQFHAPFGMVLGIEDIRNGAYGVVDSNSQPIRKTNLNVVSTGGDITVSSGDTEIFGLRLYVNEVQHIVFFPNVTTFGDIIYEPALGLAQQAVFVDTYGITDWQGRMEAPGFLIGGDTGGELLPNWEKQTNDITRYYDRFNPVDDPVLLGMARNIFGYVPKDYMNLLGVDDRSRFNFTHGSLKTKGTFQPYKAFVRGTTIGTDNVNIAEDWAWRFARYGDKRKVTILFAVNEADFVDAFQVVHFDEIGFEYSFTSTGQVFVLDDDGNYPLDDQGNRMLADIGNTKCFAVPKRFEPEELVVQIHGVLQRYGVDYTATPTSDGYNICFVSIPLAGQTITMSMNRDYVHTNNDVFYQPAGIFDTGIALRPNNVIASSSNMLLYPVEVSGSSITLPYTTYFHVFGDVDDDIFVQTVYLGDGFTTSFDTGAGNQSGDTVIVVYNGLWQIPVINYVLNTTDPQRSKVQLNFTPALGSYLIIYAVKYINNVISHVAVFQGDDVTTDFFIPGVELTSYRQVMVGVNGLFQIGPIPGQIVPNTYTVINGGIRFNLPPGHESNYLLDDHGNILYDGNGKPLIRRTSGPNYLLDDDGNILYDDNGKPLVVDDSPGDDGPSDVTITIFAILDAIAAPTQPIEDDRVIYIPQFTPPAADNRWLVTPPQEIYRDKPYRFPVDANGDVDFGKYIYWAVLVDLGGQLPGVNLFNWNPSKNLHEPIALAAVDYKTPYDPAHYSQENVVVWGENQVGTVWWDTSTAVYLDVDQFLPDYMRVSREWGRLLYFGATITRDADTVTVTTLDAKSEEPVAHGLETGDSIKITGADQPDYNGVFIVTVDSATTFTFIVYKETDLIGTGDIRVQIGTLNCYEWVASPVPPVAWDDYIKQQSGFEVYTGIVLNVDNPSYSTREVWGINGNSTITYYFWVQNNTRIIPSKNICVKDIAGRLENPALYEIPFLAILDPATMFVFIGDTVVLDYAAVEVSYEWYELPRHVEWLLIGEIDNATLVPPLVTDKLLDSILATDSHGNPVPNVTLAPIDCYGTSYFPAQTVFPNPAAALSIYLDVINNFLVNIDISNFSTIFNSLSLSDEYHPNGTGCWSRTTYWVPNIDHTVVYDMVVGYDELSHRQGLGLYAPGDIVQVNPVDNQPPQTTDQFDLWSGIPAAVYYQYDGSLWNIVGIVNHTAEINANIAVNHSKFRQFFADLISSIEFFDGNVIIFTVLFEMLRQNPVCDWFFKTSYIDLQVSQPFQQSNFIAPDQASLVLDAVLDLKPFRTKVRDFRVSYGATGDDGATDIIPVIIDEHQTDRISLIFDRIACDLTDENSWDTIPWDATVTYPEDVNIQLQFIGTGSQTCFIIPEYVPENSIVVQINGVLAAPVVDYTVDRLTRAVCFTIPPASGAIIDVQIDGPYEYFFNFTYGFYGNANTHTVVLPEAVAGTGVDSVFTSWNGLSQTPITDYVLLVTTDTEVSYLTVPSVGIAVNGVVFGGVINDIFITTVHTADGSASKFDTTLADQTDKTVIVRIDGVWQTPNDFSIDNTTFPGDSFVAFASPPPIGAKIVISAASYPTLLSTTRFSLTGDAVTTNFTIAGLDSALEPAVLVDLDGVQQSEATGDYDIIGSVIVFAIAPAFGVKINVFVVWTGLGLRLAATTSPATIQWDWAFWNYSDLGRQEYDFAGLFIGDGVTDGFSVPIPQSTTALYGVLLKFFENGVETTSEALGITYSITKLSISVNIFLSAPLPTNVYGSLYVSRGFYEGLEPTFGFQDISGVVFAPTPSTYEHFFARLISNTYDPSTAMVGCPIPEERVQTGVEDVFTIAVRTIPEGYIEPDHGLPPDPPTEKAWRYGPNFGTAIGAPYIANLWSYERLPADTGFPNSSLGVVSFDVWIPSTGSFRVSARTYFTKFIVTTYHIDSCFMRIVFNNSTIAPIEVSSGSDITDTSSYIETQSDRMLVDTATLDPSQPLTVHMEIRCDGSTGLGGGNIFPAANHNRAGVSDPYMDGDAFFIVEWWA